MTDAELQDVRSRCDAASEGPWKASIEGRDHASGSDIIMTRKGVGRGEDIEMSGGTTADYDFIAHARQDVPRMLEEIARLRKLVRS